MAYMTSDADFDAGNKEHKYVFTRVTTCPKAGKIVAPHRLECRAMWTRPMMVMDTREVSRPAQSTRQLAVIVALS